MKYLSRVPRLASSQNQQNGARYDDTTHRIVRSDSILIRYFIRRYPASIRSLYMVARRYCSLVMAMSLQTKERERKKRQKKKKKRKEKRRELLLQAAFEFLSVLNFSAADGTQRHLADLSIVRLITRDTAQVRRVLRALRRQSFRDISIWKVTTIIPIAAPAYSPFSGGGGGGSFAAARGSHAKVAHNHAFSLRNEQRHH